MNDMTIPVITNVLNLLDGDLLVHRSIHRLEVLFVVVDELHLVRPVDDGELAGDDIERLL